MAGELVVSFSGTAAPFHPHPGSHPGWWLPSGLFLPPKLTTRCVCLSTGGVQLSGCLKASPQPCMGLLPFLKSEMTLLSLSWRPCLLFQSSVLKHGQWCQDSGGGEGGQPDYGFQTGKPVPDSRCSGVFMPQAA